MPKRVFSKLVLLPLYPRESPLTPLKKGRADLQELNGKITYNGQAIASGERILRSCTNANILLLQQSRAGTRQLGGYPNQTRPYTINL
jgi:hypothetical protein